jgi:hypothetical protein
MMMLGCSWKLSSRPTQNALYSNYRNYFFGLSLTLTKNTMCLNLCSSRENPRVASLARGSLFSDIVNGSDYMASNGRMICGQLLKKVWKEVAVA